MRLDEVTLYENRSHRILKEGWLELTEAQQHYQLRFEKELFPLLEQYVKLAEAQLTADQIKDIFSGAEQVAMDSGDNKTIAGKVGAGALAAAKLPVDIAKKVDAKINELGRMAQNAGPVKNMDQKFNDLKKQITANNSDSKIVQGIQKISDWAKENPGKASLAVGILTTMAAFAGGPAGGAAAGLILRATKDLLQGQDLSTAVGKSLKTAAYGALAGAAINGLTDNMIDNIATGSEAEANAMLDNFEKANFTAAVDKAVADAGFDSGVLDGAMNYSSSGNINGFFYNYDFTMTPEQVAEYKNLLSATQSAKVFSPEYYRAAGELHGFLSTAQQANADLTALARTVADIPKDMLTGDQLDAAIAVLDNADAAIEKISALGGGAAAAAQGALATVDDNNKEMHKVKPIDPEEKKQLELSLKGGGMNEPKESLSMEERFELYLLEADPAQGELPLDNPNSFGAKLKRGAKGLAGKAAGAVKGAASSAAGAVKQGAKDLGNKVTANKLMKTWKSMGEPLDSGSIANILQDAGLSSDQITQISKTANVKLSPTATKSASQPATSQPATSQPSTAQPSTAQPAATKQEPKSAISKGAEKAVSSKPIKKGDTKEVNGKTYQWAGALWVDTATNKPVSIANAMQMGLGNPKLDPIIAAAKKDPALAKLIKQQIMAKGVKAGTAQAQQAQKAGVKGTEPVATKSKAAKKVPNPKVTAKTGTKVKYKTGTPKKPAKAPAVQT